MRSVNGWIAFKVKFSIASAGFCRAISHLAFLSSVCLRKCFFGWIAVRVLRQICIHFIINRNFHDLEISNLSIFFVFSILKSSASFCRRLASSVEPWCKVDKRVELMENMLTPYILNKTNDRVIFPDTCVIFISRRRRRRYVIYIALSRYSKTLCITLKGNQHLKTYRNIKLFDRNFNILNIFDYRYNNTHFITFQLVYYWNDSTPQWKAVCCLVIKTMFSVIPLGSYSFIINRLSCISQNMQHLPSCFCVMMIVVYTPSALWKM